MLVSELDKALDGVPRRVSASSPGPPLSPPQARGASAPGQNARDGGCGGQPLVAGLACDLVQVLEHVLRIDNGDDAVQPVRALDFFIDEEVPLFSAHIFSAIVAMHVTYCAQTSKRSEQS